MEARKITIVSTKTQSKKVIMSEAETLAELKADLMNANIDYTDMTFYEGTARVELIDDASYLPKNVPYTNKKTGETVITNELVFMLTNSNKKIKSGMTRKEAYEYIKQNQLGNEVIERFGRNYTQVSTELLEDFINSNEEIEEYKECSCDKSSKVREALYNLVNVLIEENMIDEADLYAIFNSVEHKDESSYSDDEIEDMFGIKF